MEKKGPVGGWQRPQVYWFELSRKTTDVTIRVKYMFFMKLIGQCQVLTGSCCLWLTMKGNTWISSHLFISKSGAYCRFFYYLPHWLYMTSITNTVLPTVERFYYPWVQEIKKYSLQKQKKLKTSAITDSQNKHWEAVSATALYLNCSILHIYFRYIKLWLGWCRIF